MDKAKRKIDYTDFKDEVLGVCKGTMVAAPKITGKQYAKKVEDYLRDHLDDMVIHRLRTNKPLTPTNLEELEKILTAIGQEDGETLLSRLLARGGSSSLAYFVRSLVGMDRSTAPAAFSQYLNDRSLTVPQICFIEMVIDQLTARGMMESAALYEQPFSNLHADGPEALFARKDEVVGGIFQVLEAIQSNLGARAA